MPDTHPPIHLRLRGRFDDATQRLALRAVLHAAHLLGLATGTHLRQLRGLDDPLAQLRAELEEARLREQLAHETTEILTARFAKVPERHRPYYSPAQRFRILEIRNFLGWSARDTARTFLVCPGTILNWARAADPDARTAGATVIPTPPIRRAADGVRAVIQMMARFDIGGADLTARILARAGWRVSARSVRRYRKERTVAPPPAPEPPSSNERPHRPVSTRFVHHVWMMDVSVVKQFLGPNLFMAAVFDAHSRVPLAVRVFQRSPSAKDMACLLRRAAKAFARPRYVITDLGGEFTGRAFRRAVARLGAVHRTAAADSILATARLERFWKTLKELARLYRLQLTLTVGDLERRLEQALLYYVAFRPHEGLGGATPLEVFLDAKAAHQTAIEPPRGRPGETCRSPPFRLGFLDRRTRHFPLLVAA